MKLELQELKIPAGWFISYNQFYNIYPTEETVDSVDSVFMEDILQFTNDSRHRLLDLGWYPEFDFIGGAYKMVVYEGDFCGKLLYELKSKSKKEIVSEINRLLLDITEGHL